ncbi:MAG: tRNA (adenosine(37)-N6)-threonylcarbamoyltransferase complex dimerization subunit type 1 TsaB [Deltaproteobacteria bacterium]|jgi:tRNA threonylcarbamoyladenosine biosynthesis protein TsaB|nr:tRNA (adenosine(37)-N6)-threonylcarbamoyltransferase complex dimerization subunit type 1 TsaB [Deltaproteobacteria bacterium]
MKILSIDTTSMRGSFALSEGESCISQIQQSKPDTHSAKLLETIDTLFQQSNWKLKDIEGVAVAVGPGSFTGLRIGLATAKGIALSLGIPIVGVSSLKSLSINGSDAEKSILTLIDARRGELYAALWKRDGKKISIPTMDECVLSPEKLVEEVKSIGTTCYAVGDGALEYHKFLEDELGDTIRIAQGNEVLPMAHNLALVALAKFESHEGDDLTMLVPNYVRQSDAEIGFKGK